MIVVEKFLPNRLALKERIEIDLLLRLLVGGGRRGRLRFGFRLRCGRRSGTFFQFRNIRIDLRDACAKAFNFISERLHLCRGFRILLHGRLYLRRKALCLRAQPRDMSLNRIHRAARLPPRVVCRDGGDPNTRHDKDK